MTAAADNASAEFQRAHYSESRQNEARQNGSGTLLTEPEAPAQQRNYQHRVTLVLTEYQNISARCI